MIAEKADFFVLGFKVLIPLIQENKIEHSDAPLDVFEFVFPAVAKVLPVDLAIYIPGEYMTFPLIGRYSVRVSWCGVWPRRWSCACPNGHR